MAKIRELTGPSEANHSEEDETSSEANTQEKEALKLGSCHVTSHELQGCVRLHQCKHT